jgi:hypothetical protein
MRVAPVEAKDVGNYNIMIDLEDAGKAGRKYVMAVTVEKVVENTAVEFSYQPKN